MNNDKKHLGCSSLKQFYLLQMSFFESKSQLSFINLCKTKKKKKLIGL